MAKEDFCFNYYDGDAARDMAHMNRLERGAYGDIIVSQRKFGHLSLHLIKKTLGRDFEEVWEALEIILIKDEAEKYFIEWLENSIQKMKRQSAHQSENGKKGGRPKSETKANENPNINPNETQTGEKIKPLGNGYGNGIEELKGGVGEKFLVPEMFSIFKKSVPAYPGQPEKDFKPLLSIANFLNGQLSHTGPPEANTARILTEWTTIASLIRADDFYRQKSLSTISNHIQEIFQKKANENPNINPNETQTGEKINPLGNGYGYGNGIKEFKGGVGEIFLVTEMFSIFKISIPGYPGQSEKDFKPLLSIAKFLNGQLRCTGPPDANAAAVLAEWATITNLISADDFYRQKSLATISNHIQEIFQKKANDTPKKSPVFTKPGTGKSAGAKELLARFEQQLSAGG